VENFIPSDDTFFFNVCREHIRRQQMNVYASDSSSLRFELIAHQKLTLAEKGE
jgi:hypothetical protein